MYSKLVSSNKYIGNALQHLNTMSEYYVFAVMTIEIITVADICLTWLCIPWTSSIYGIV